MKAERYYLGAPTRIELDMGVVLDGATQLSIEARRPNGTTESWPATLEDGSVLVYDPVESQWDVLGQWKLQGKFLMPNMTDHNFSKSVSVTIRQLFT